MFIPLWLLYIVLNCTREVNGQMASAIGLIDIFMSYLPSFTLHFFLYFYAKYLLINKGIIY